MTTPPEILEQWRKEFESIAVQQGIDISRTTNNGEYDLGYVESRWCGFIMRCKSLVIGLPHNSFYWQYGEGITNLTVIQDIIESAGYSVEVKE